MLTSSNEEGEKEGKWDYHYTSMGCLRINKDGEQYDGVADGYLDQNQEDWGALSGEDPHLDLNSFRTKVEQLTGSRDAELTGMEPGSKAGLIAASSSIVTMVFVGGMGQWWTTT